MNDKAALDEIAVNGIAGFANNQNEINWAAVLNKGVISLYRDRLATLPSKNESIDVNEHTFPTAQDAAKYLTWLLEGFRINAEDYLPTQPA